MRIRTLDVLKSSLLGKWPWKYAQEHSLQRNVIKGKFQELDGGWCMVEVREAFRVEKGGKRQTLNHYSSQELAKNQILVG